MASVSACVRAFYPSDSVTGRHMYALYFVTILNLQRYCNCQSFDMVSP